MAVIGQKTLDAVYISLTPEQKQFLDEHVQRGKQTKWLNAWAKRIGSVLTEQELDSSEQAEESLLEWELVKYEDNLVVDGSIRCECGRALRHRYTVMHQPTGKEYKLGIVHLEQHTGLDPEIVRLITKGLKEIDLEREEILSKIMIKWRLPITIPFGLSIPENIREQLRLKLPLLDRQVKSIEQLIEKYKQQLWEQAERERLLKKQEYLSKLNIGELLSKLRAGRINDIEANALYEVVAFSPDLLQGYTLGQIKSATSAALGHTRNVNIRKWLVEIEYLP